MLFDCKYSAELISKGYEKALLISKGCGVSIIIAINAVIPKGPKLFILSSIPS
jgi:hypothetical protein